MRTKIKGVSIKVHPKFFDNIFEPNRKSLRNKLKLNDLTQVEFTGLLANGNFNFKIDKQKLSKLQKSIKFRPLKRRYR